MTPPKGSIRVLYLEDNPADLELTLRHMARHAPHLELTAVSSGREALDRLGAGRFDAVLLDHRLPGLSGVEVIQEINRRELEVPVVMVTGSGDTETALQALKAGAFDYVVKQGNYLAALPATIEDAVARFRCGADDSGRRSVRVLYAEHSPQDVDLTLRHFQCHAPHFTLEAVSSGEEALRRLGDGGFDLFLLDYRLPGVDGLQVLKEVRGRRLPVPVIFVAGNGDDGMVAHVLKVGALDYVPKRENYLERLPSVLENALARHRLAQEREALLVLNRLSHAVASSLDLEVIFREVAAVASTLLRVDQCLISRLDDDGVTLHPAAWVGMPEDVAHRFTLRAGEGPIGEAVSTQRPVKVPAQEPAPAAGPPASPGQTFIPALCVPILTGTKILGVLSVASTTPRRFRPSDATLLDSLADHAAIAMENARLFLELKRSYEDLRRSQDLLLRQEKMAALGRLASGLAHELNNPLTAVAGFAEGLLEKTKSPDLATVPGCADFPRYLKHIAEQALRCGDLVNRLLTYARQREPQRRPVDLWEVVEDSLALMAAKVRKLGSRFQTTRASGSLLVLADQNMLQQVVINLVTNAMDAVEGGGTVRILAYRDEPKSDPPAIALEVADTGSGIAPEDRPRLYDPFFTTKGPERGTGLGLPICLSLVEQHGGTLTLESPGPGQGATATVRLPAAAA